MSTNVLIHLVNIFRKAEFMLKYHSEFLRKDILLYGRVCFGGICFYVIHSESIHIPLLELIPEFITWNSSKGLQLIQKSFNMYSKFLYVCNLIFLQLS